MRPSVTSVIVHDLDVPDVSTRPAKADAPLIIDSDAVLPLASSLQCLQAVAGWKPEILQAAGLVKIKELSASDALEGSEPRYVEILKESFGSGVAERPNHLDRVYDVTRNMSNAIASAASAVKELTSNADGPHCFQGLQAKASIAVKAGEAVPRVLSKVRKAPVALSVTRRWYSTSVVAAA